ncbi:hypothetical protein L9F63_015107, partial [Diploptera punctata]
TEEQVCHCLCTASEIVQGASNYQLSERINSTPQWGVECPSQHSSRLKPLVLTIDNNDF